MTCSCRSLIAALTILSVASASLAQVDAVDNAPVGRGLDANQDYAPYPAPDAGYVTDQADLLTRDEEEEIEQLLWRVEAETGVEFAVVTIGSISDFPGTANASIEDFAKGLFDKYGIGNLPKNDGILLLVAKNDREARIELGEYYGRSSDDEASAVMTDVIVPRFKNGRYADGISDGVRSALNDIAGVRTGTNWLLIGMVVAVPVVALIAVSLFRNGKRGWGWVCVGILIILVLAIVKMVYTIMSNLPDSSSDSWSSGGFGGGFGGGSSGGGGATGSW